jgi:DNA gyrase/topoisomerase IV subunit B
MNDDFKILSAREHCRTRPNMYLGSTSKEKVERFISGKWGNYEYVPAIIKMVDEIIDNAIDEAIRTDYKFANQISVTVSGNSIEISDNGRGIPQAEITTPDGDKILQPVAAWTRTNAGSSFNDNRTTIGANGVGSACTNFMSTSFHGSTWSKGNRVDVHCTNGAEEIKWEVSKKTGNGTLVRFTPDFDLFAINNLAEIDVEAFIEDRLASLEIAFPEIAFKFNKRRLKASTLRKYAEMYLSDEAASIVISQGENASFFITSSEDGFRTTSYINGVNTRQGGTYVDYITNGIVDELTKMVKRKFKIDVAKSTFKSGMTFVLFGRNFEDPKYDSQTKERLTSNITEVKAHYDADEFDKIAKKIMQSEDIIGPIVEAQLAKKIAADKRAATLAQKKLKKVRVAKHISSTTRDSTLFITEGDSAIGYFLKVRNPKTSGAYPLRGVIMNVWDMKPADVLKNKELGELVAVLGLDINDPNSVDTMDYKNIATLTDQDHDGIGHIMPLLIAFFYKFWPRLFEEGRVHVARTPILISSKAKDVKWFYTYDDASEFKSKGNGYHHRYIKGLASHTEDEYDKIINTPKLDTIVIDDPHWFEIIYGKSAQLRKDWLK